MPKRAREGDTLVDALAAARPGAVVFDLDHTLWNGNCEEFSAAKIVGPAKAVDTASGRTLALYEAVPRIFAALDEAGVAVAIASASPAAATAARLLRGFGLAVRHAEVHPGKKDAHLKAIALALGVPLGRVLFFDDLAFNIRAADALGVGASVLVRSGLTEAAVLAALRSLRERGEGAAMMRAWMGGSARAAAPEAPRESAAVAPAAEPRAPEPPPVAAPATRGADAGAGASMTEARPVASMAEGGTDASMGGAAESMTDAQAARARTNREAALAIRQRAEAQIPQGDSAG